MPGAGAAWPAGADGFAETWAEVGGRRTRAVVGGAGPAVLLLHGWPMTSHAWRRVAPPLAAGGRRVVAPDLPGLGGSDGPSDGYDVPAVAADVLAAVRALGHERFAVVGHDIGGMVAFALAASAPEAVTALCCAETDAPGIGAWEQAWTNPKLWHFHFHGTPDLPEALVAGRERTYLKFFYDRDGRTPGAWTDADLDVYAAAYAAPGRLSAGFDYYRAFPRSAERDRDLAGKGRLRMPVLAMGGEHSLAGKVADDLTTVAEDVRRLVLPGCGHFVPEERPAELAEAVLALTADTG